mgnify:CR=1 FL=1
MRSQPLRKAMIETHIRCIGPYLEFPNVWRIAKVKLLCLISSLG